MGEFVGIKCVILTSGNTEIGKATVHSLVNYCGHSQDSGKCIITDSESRWLQCFQYPSEEFETSTASLTGLPVIETSPGKPHLFVINPYPQHAIHDPLLISSEGVYVIFCDDGKEEEKMVYLRRVLDRIMISTPSSEEEKSLVFVGGLKNFKESFAEISKDYEPSLRVSIVEVNRGDSFVPLLYQLYSDYVKRIKDHEAICKCLHDLTCLDTDSKRHVVLLEEWKGDPKMLEALHLLGIIFYKSEQGINHSDNLIFPHPEVLHEMLCEAKFNEERSHPDGMDIEQLKGKFRSRYLSGSKKIPKSFAKLLLQLKLAVETPNGRTVLLHSLPNWPGGKFNPNEVPSSVDPLFVKFKGMGYVSEVFFVEIARQIFDKLEAHSCVSITLDYMQFEILAYQLHMYRRNGCIEFRFQHDDFFKKGDKMSEGRKLKSVQHCQNVLKAIRSSLNESSKKAYKYYGSYTFGFMCSEGGPVGGKAFAEYNEQHDCLFCPRRPVKMYWSQKIWFASPPPDLPIASRPYTITEDGYELHVLEVQICPDSEIAPENLEKDNPVKTKLQKCYTYLRGNLPIDNDLAAQLFGWKPQLLDGPVFDEIRALNKQGKHSEAFQEWYQFAASWYTEEILRVFCECLEKAGKDAKQKLIEVAKNIRTELLRGEAFH